MMCRREQRLTQTEDWLRGAEMKGRYPIMKKMLSIAMVLMMLVGLMLPIIASAESPAGNQYMWVNCADGKRLNVRENPDTNAKILYRVDSGKRIEIIRYGINGAWAYVRQDGKNCGYVMEKFLVAQKPGKYEVTERSDNFRTVSAYRVSAKPLNGNTTKSVCLRTKPNKTAASIRRLAAGDQLKVVAVGKTWSKVVDLTTGRTGYVANDYIARL